MKIAFENSLLHLHTYGTGPVPMVALHGFGQDGSVFAQVESGLGTEYTLFALDLPNHGKTEWRAAPDMSPQTWKTVLEAVLEAVGHGNSTSFSLAGFSMGGRWALQGAMQLTDRLESLWLFSPEGLSMNWPYYIARHTLLGRHFMPRLIARPKPAFVLLDLLQRTKIISARQKSFALRNLESEEVRQLVWDAWTAMSRLRINRRKLAARLNAAGVPVEIIHGRRDRILTPRACRLFARMLDQVRIDEPDYGHFVIRPEINPLLVELTTDRNRPQTHST